MVKKKADPTKEVKVDRRAKSDRREEERRQRSETVAVERRQSSRRKVPRRRQIDPTTCERDYTGDEIEFMTALEVYKRSAGRMFPTCSEILEVIRDIGYAKLSPEELEARRSCEESAEEEKPAEEENAETEIVAM